MSTSVAMSAISAYIALTLL